MRALSVRSTIALAGVVLLSAAAVLAQSTPLVIHGRVLASDNDRPLRRALVTLTGTRPALTDDEGRFALEVADLSVSFTVSKAGYASTGFTPPRRPTANRELLFRIARGGVISGRILDSNGEPAVLESAASTGAPRTPASISTARGMAFKVENRRYPMTIPLVGSIEK